MEKRINEIISRELADGTFDDTCTVDERYDIRNWLYKRKGKMEEYLDIGMANGWTETPELVKRCANKMHPVTKLNLGRCLTEVRCDICRYVYKVDSSD